MNREWHSEALPRYVRVTKQAQAPTRAGAAWLRRIAAPCSACTRRAVQGGGWQGCRQPNLRKVQTDWEAWCRRSLGDDVRLILDGTVVGYGSTPKATSISLLVVLGIRRDGQKAVRNMGGESEAASRGLLDDLIGRGQRAASFVIIDGVAGLEKALSLV